MDNMPVRVLHVVGGMNAGGIETLLMTVYRLVDREKIQFDFLCPNVRGQFFYENEIDDLGGVIYRIKQSRKEPLATRRRLAEFFEIHPYSIIHVHASALDYLPVLKSAARAGVPTRVLHAHNSSRLVNSPRTLLKYICHIVNRAARVREATDVFVCSEDAAAWFGLNRGKRGRRLIRNGVDTERFRFAASKRKSAREELGIRPDEFVVGNVGRYCPAKNQLFLLEVFAGLVEHRSNSKLVLVGAGDMEEEIALKVRALGIRDKVILLHDRNDIDRLQCAFDVFCFPSRFEGLGIAMVEAEASGITCLVSDRIPHDGMLTDHVHLLPIDRGIAPWVDLLEQVRIGERFRGDFEVVRAAGYDILTTATELQRFYLERADGQVRG